MASAYDVTPPKTFVGSNLEPIGPADLNYLLGAAQDSVSLMRLLGSNVGILPPTLPNLAVSEFALQVADFKMRFNLGDPTKIDVGYEADNSGPIPIFGGAAFSSDGKLIQIDKNTTWQTTSYTYAGVPVTRRSGNIAIPLASLGVLNYVFISYQSENDVTVPINLVPPSSAVVFPRMIGTYIIRVSTSAVKAPGEVFLGTVNYVTTTIDVSARVYSRVQQKAVNVYIDPSLAPASYAAGIQLSLSDHVNALGTGVLSPTNPHAYSINDVTGGGAEPLNATYHAETLGDGIIDQSLAGKNAPASASAAMLASINNSAFNVGSTLYDARVQTAALLRTTGNNQEAYVAGTRMTDCYPHVSDITGVTGTDAFVGFRAATNPGGSDPTGTWTIYITPNIAIAGSALLSKTQAALVPGQMAICSVYWDATAGVLSQDQFSTNTVPTDLRNLGVVTAKTIATTSFDDPVKGMLTAASFDNLIANGDGSVPTAYTSPTVLASWATWNVNGTLALSRIVGGAAAVGLPGAATSIQALLTPAANNVDCYAATYARPRPSRTYTVSFYVESSSNFPPNLTLQFGSSITSGFTAYSDPVKAAVPIRDGATFQKVTVHLKTYPSVDVTNLSRSLVFRWHNDKPVGSAGTFTISNITVVEGEWTTEFVGPRVNPGECFFWYRTDTCPAGSVEVAPSAGRLLVSRYPGGVNGMGHPGAAGAPASNDANGLGNHVHYVPGGPWNTGASGGGTESIGNLNTQGANPLPFIPLFVALLCERQ